MADIDFTTMQQEIQAMAERFGTTTDGLSDFIKVTGKGTKEFKKQIEDLNKEIKKGQAGYAQQKKVLDELNDALSELGDTTDDAAKTSKKQSLLAERDALAHSAMMRGVTEDVAEGVTKSTVSMVQGAGAFVKGLQANQSAAQLSGDLFKIGIDVAAAGIKTAGGAAEKFGSKMMDAKNPFVAAIGMVTTGLGMVANATAETAAKVAKFAVDVAQVEVEKTYKAFNSMSASGAMFADGMTGMRNAAGAAGMTVDLFANVLKNQSANIGASGLGINEGAKRIGGALTAGGASMKKNLLNLGYGFEEQAELVAETMKSMRGSTSGPLRASNQQVAEQTQKYAENLRIIAAITGEDAKKKMAQVQDEANQLAFQQKLAKKSPEEQAAIMRAFSNMNSLQRKNFMDMVNFGSVINSQGASAAALSGGLRDSVSEAYQNYQQGTLDDAKMRNINARENGRMQKEFLDQTSIGLVDAAGIPGHASDLAKSFMQSINEIKLATPEAIKAGEKAAKDQEKTTDGLTKGVVDAETAAMELKKSLQNILTPAIMDFANLSKKMLRSVQDTLDEYGYGKTKEQKASDEKNTRILKNQYTKEYGGFGEMRYQQDLAAWNKEQARNKELQQLKEDGDIEGYNAELAKIADEKKRMENLRAMGMAQPERAPSMIENYMKGISKHANGGSIRAGATGIVGEAGPELVSGPASVISAATTEKFITAANTTNTDTVKVLQGAIRSLESMMSGLKRVKAEESEDLASMLYEGTLGGSDFKPATWATNSSITAQGGAQGMAEMMKGWVADLQNPEEQRNSSGASVVQDSASNEHIKSLAENTIRMVEEMKRMNEAMYTNNKYTSGILQNSYQAINTLS